MAEPGDPCLLSDWEGWWLRERCACGVSQRAVRLLLNQHGDRPLRAFCRGLRCRTGRCIPLCDVVSHPEPGVYASPLGLDREATLIPVSDLSWRPRRGAGDPALLSDWYGWSLVMECGCGQRSAPVRMMLDEHGDNALKAFCGRLCCPQCRRRPRVELVDDIRAYLERAPYWNYGPPTIVPIERASFPPPRKAAAKRAARAAEE